MARSVVKVSREHHPQGKTLLVRDYTKNGQTRRLKLVPPRRTKARLSEEEIAALGDCEPVGGRVYAHGTRLADLRSHR